MFIYHLHFGKNSLLKTDKNTSQVTPMKIQILNKKSPRYHCMMQKRQLCGELF